MTVRLNDYHDLPMLQALYEAAGHPPTMGWRWVGDFSGYWAMAEDEQGRAVGCVQLGLSRPQGTLEALCVPTMFPKRIRAIIVRELSRFAVHLFAALGMQSIRFQADARLEGWLQVLEHRGARRLHAHPTYLWEIV